MKLGYKRLLVFMLAIITTLSVNAFFVNFLSGYKMIIFVIALIVFFKFYFVLEKDRHRYLKDILFEVFFFVILFFILFYLLGIVIGLARTANYFTYDGIKNFLLPLTLYCILREYFRYNMLCKADGNKLCTILVVITFIFFDVSNDYFSVHFDSNFAILRFCALSLLPALSKNISYSYVTKKVGYKPIILFDLVFVLYQYVIPIIPNPNEYLLSIIILLVPVLFAFRIVRFFNLKKLDRIDSDYKKNKAVGMAVPLFLVLVMIYFYSGYFKFYAIAIASGSMSPIIGKGDVVVVDRKFNELEVGDVIAFKKENLIIVHRIVKILEIDDKLYYYTKGDANAEKDNWVIFDDSVIGRVVFNLPYIGYPTLWFNGN